MDKIHKEALRQETLTAERYGGRVTPGSGSGSFDKNDVTTDEWSFEVKTTEQKGYRLTLENFLKTENNALEQGLRPAMITAFVLPSGRVKRLVTLDEDDFIEKVIYGQTGTQRR